MRSGTTISVIRKAPSIIAGIEKTDMYFRTTGKPNESIDEPGPVNPVHLGGQYMRGLALEGGGARGAYHIGVVKALMENGYDFDGFVGTSIGAINAAILRNNVRQK